MTGTCPECEGSISLENPLRGEIVPCPTCGVELELTNLNPVALELVAMAQEDIGE